MKKHIAEAYRYIDNANKIIKDNLKIDNGFYSDSKYVKMAGHTAYTGVLMALEPLIKEYRDKKQRPDIYVYRTVLGKRNKHILNTFNEAYNFLHMFMGYDGSRSVDIKKTGFKYAKDIIEWADENTTALGGIKTKK